MPGNNVIGSSATSSWHLVVISYADFPKILLVLNDGKYWKFLRWLRSARLVFRSCRTRMFLFSYFSFPINPFATKWYSIEIEFIFGFVWLLIFWVNVLGSKCIWLLQDEFWFHLLTLDFYESICIYLDYLKKRLFFDILHLFTISEAFWNLIFVYQLNDFRRRWNIYRKCK